MTKSEQEISFVILTNGIAHPRLLFIDCVFMRFL
jgi:hypothetical protein